MITWNISLQVYGALAAASALSIYRLNPETKYCHIVQAIHSSTGSSLSKVRWIKFETERLFCHLNRDDFHVVNNEDLELLKYDMLVCDVMTCKNVEISYSQLFLAPCHACAVHRYQGRVFQCGVIGPKKLHAGSLPGVNCTAIRLLTNPEVQHSQISSH